MCVPTRVSLWRRRRVREDLYSGVLLPTCRADGPSVQGTGRLGGRPGRDRTEQRNCWVSLVFPGVRELERGVRGVEVGRDPRRGGVEDVSSS